MAPDLKELLRSAAVQPPEPMDLEDVQRRARTVRRGRRVRAVTSGVAAVVLVALAVAQFADVLRPADVEFAEPPPKDPKAHDKPPDTWTEVPVAPITPRFEAATVWTGTEMVVWGGTDPGKKLTPLDDGAAFDPATHRWRQLPPAPVSDVTAPAAVWTGDEVVIWGATGEAPVAMAYSPQWDTWRTLAPPLNHGYASTVWTGSEMIVWGGQDHDGRPSNAGAAYDPQQDRWRTIAAAPIQGRLAHGVVWTGDEMIVWGGATDPGPSRQLFGDGAAYDPRRDTWRVIADSPLRPRMPGAALWTGREMVVVGGVSADGFSPGDVARYEPSGDAWELLPEVHDKELTQFAWAGDQIIAWGSASPLSMSPKGGSSQMLPAPPTPLGDEAAVVWTGDRLIVWSGLAAHDTTPVEGGVVLDTRAYPAPDKLPLPPPGEPETQPEDPPGVGVGAAWPPAGVDGPWRKDPTDLAVEFGVQVLKWRDARVTDGEPSEDGRFGARLTLESRAADRFVGVLVWPDDEPQSARPGDRYVIAQVSVGGGPGKEPRLNVSIRGDEAAVVFAPGEGTLPGAARATLRLQYGIEFGSTNDIGTPPPWEFNVPLSFSRKEPGSLLILVEDADGNVIGAQGIGLPPGDFEAG